MESLMYEFGEDNKSNKEAYKLTDDLNAEDGFLNSDELSLDIQALLEKTSNNFENDSLSGSQLFPGLLNTPPVHVHSLDNPVPAESDQIIKTAATEANIPEADLKEEAELMPQFLQFQSEDSLSRWLSTSGLIKEEESEGSSCDQTIVITLPTDQGSEDAACAVEVPCSPSSVSLLQHSNLKSPPPSKGASRRRNLAKDSEEYRARRDRNNVAVRKSRDKAKVKQRETDERVKGLTDENERLQKKCDLLTKELNVLKGLFLNVGANLPEKLHKYLP